MTMHGNAGGGFEFFAVNSRENSNIVIGAASRGDQTVVLVDHLNEVADNKRHSLNTFELFFGAEFLSILKRTYLLSLI